MLKRFATLLTLLLTAFTITSFLGCDDPESIVLDQILQEVSTHQSPYTGGLTRIGTVKGFGLNLREPTAIEWNGETLYMIAHHGQNQSKAKYLFRLDRHTGIAEFVNRSAIDLGGSFRGGRTFTQVLRVSPKDMTWIKAPDHYVEGIDFPMGANYKGDMFASCPVLDSIVFINLKTGYASRMTFKRHLNLLNEDGSPKYAAPRGLANDGETVYSTGVLLDSPRDDAELLRVIPGTFTQAYPINETPRSLSVGESSPRTMCFDGQHLYMSGADTNVLYIIDRQTGLAHFVADWYFAPMPDGFRRHELGDILNIEEDVRGNIWITGLAHDGVDMFAVEGFTDALYKLEKR